VTFAREHGIVVETHAVITPNRQIATSGRAALESLWSNTELDNITVKRGEVRESALKAIPNIISGMANKKRNTKQVASLFLCEDEARACSPLVAKIGPGYMAVKQGEKDLSEGYLPVGRLILDAMRRKLFRMVAAVGGHAVGVRTDCVYVAPENEAAARAGLVREGFRFGGIGWESVGSLKVEKKEDAGMEKLLRLKEDTP
jgi:hypothetical protein